MDDPSIEQPGRKIAVLESMYTGRKYSVQTHVSNEMKLSVSTKCCRPPTSGGPEVHHTYVRQAENPRRFVS